MSSLDHAGLGDPKSLDHQPFAREAAAELNDLRSYLQEFYEAEDAQDQRSSGWYEWLDEVLGDLPAQADEELDDVLDARTYEPLDLGADAERTFVCKPVIDTTFSAAAKARVERCLKLMLQQGGADQTRCFITRAQKKGLTGRRRRGLPFPHPLPYRSSPPVNPDEKYTEEALVVSAATRFVFAREDAKAVKLTIKRLDKDGVLGQAPVNSYNYDGALRISLNNNSLERTGPNDETDEDWAGVIAHEILHNLGWGHGKGSYAKSLAIEIYEFCISGGRSLSPTLVR